MDEILATMITLTTYGTWLRGDQRGWVDNGKTLPPDPELESADRDRMKHNPFLFQPSQFLRIGQFIGDSLNQRKCVAIHAMTVQSWHCHIVIAATVHSIPDVVRCAKDAVRYGLRIGRPIWTAGYDNRFRLDRSAARARINYVEKHNLREGLPSKPWTFIVEFAPSRAPAPSTPGH
jgi:hypothetical protein